MKRIKNLFVSCLLCLFAALCAVGFCACQKGGEVKATLLSATDTQVVIRVDETDGKGTLLNAMDALQDGENFTFSLTDGMVTEINGVKNRADFGACWMLYTSDSEMSSAAWGTVEYDGQTLGSAVVGAEALTVVKGGVYVWAYKAM